MKKFRRLCTALPLISALAVAAIPLAASAAGLMVPIGDAGPGLSIRSHDVSVSITDGFAITQVEQVFANPTGQDMEAMYRFPVPDKAAVSEFTVWIDGSPVIGEVMEKQEANEIYEEEKAAGREAGITNKNKHYNFEIRVSPVRALQDVQIRLVYMQPVNIDTGIGRYVYPLEDGQTDDAANAFWTSNTEVKENFSFSVDLRSSNPVTGARVPAHPQASVTMLNDQEWQISMANGSPSSTSDQPANDSQLENGIDAQLSSGSLNEAPQKAGGIAASLDKDIVVYWRLATDVPGSVDLVTHKEPGMQQGTFMLTLTPGDDLAPITEGRDWVFVLDTSGSMKGKYATLVDGVQRALGQLRSEDRFRLVRFSDDAAELTSGWIGVSDESVRRWSTKLANTAVGGGTNLFAGTKTGLKALDSDRTSVIVLVTDGEANVGTTEKKYFLDLMRKYDARLFTAVMGNGANRPLLEAMTEVSNGFAVSVSNSDDIVGKLMEFTSKSTHQALHDIKLKIKGVKTTELTPKVTTTLYRGEQLMVLGHYYAGGEAVVSLSGKVSGEDKLYETRFDFPDISESNPEIERLWAYAKTQELQDMIDYLGDDSEYKSAITDVAVANGLVTDYTSMVVMREEQFAARSIDRKNKNRRQVEIAAANSRNSQSVVSTRVDQKQPAFSTPRASHSGGGNGGGAFTYELLFLIWFLALVGIRRFERSS